MKDVNAALMVFLQKNDHTEGLAEKVNAALSQS